MSAFSPHTLSMRGCPSPPHCAGRFCETARGFEVQDPSPRSKRARGLVFDLTTAQGALCGGCEDSHHTVRALVLSRLARGQSSRCESARAASSCVLSVRRVHVWGGEAASRAAGAGNTASILQ